MPDGIIPPFQGCAGQTRPGPQGFALGFPIVPLQGGRPPVRPVLGEMPDPFAKVVLG